MELLHTATEFFHDAVTDALKSQKVAVKEPTEFYLVNLLVEFMDASKVDEEPLALKLAQSRCATPDERVRALKDIGDTSLYVGGFFGDSLSRRLVDLDYYIAMGGAAYGQLASIVRRSAFRDVYDELAGKFPQFVEVLHEIRMNSVFAGSDVVRMCEEWLKTGSDWLERKLRASGVMLTPQRTPQ